MEDDVSEGKEGAYHEKNVPLTADNSDYGASKSRERRVCRRGGRAFLTQRASDTESESVTSSKVSLSQKVHLILH